MDMLKKQMQSVLKIFDMLDNRNMTINVYTDVEHDVEKFAHFAYVYYVGVGLKEKYKAKLKSKYRFPDKNVDLNIEFSSYKSNEDKIVIDKTKMLSHKLLKIMFFICNFQKMDKIYDIFIEWGKSRQKPVKEFGPIELEMTVPPDDSNDPNYKMHIKKWFKFCEKNPEWIKNVYKR